MGVLLIIQVVLVVVNLGLAVVNLRFGNRRMAGISLLTALAVGALAVITASTL